MINQTRTITISQIFVHHKLVRVYQDISLCIRMIAWFSYEWIGVLILTSDRFDVLLSFIEGSGFEACLRHVRKKSATKVLRVVFQATLVSSGLELKIEIALVWMEIFLIFTREQTCFVLILYQSITSW